MSIQVKPLASNYLAHSTVTNAEKKKKYPSRTGPNQTANRLRTFQKIWLKYFQNVSKFSISQWCLHACTCTCKRVLTRSLNSLRLQVCILNTSELDVVIYLLTSTSPLKTSYMYIRNCCTLKTDYRPITIRKKTSCNSDRKHKEK